MRLVRATGLWASLVLGGCTGARVQTDFDPTAAFDGLETYGWMPDRPPDAFTDRPFLQRMIHDSVDEQLARQGYRLVESGRVDFWVNYQVAAGEDLDVRTTYDVYGRGDRYYMDVFNDIDTRSFVAGTIILDVLRPDDRALLWRGVAEKAVEAGPENAQRAIEEATRKMLARFPPEKEGQ